MFQVPIKILFSRLFLTLLLFLFFLFPLTNLAVHEIFLSSRFGNHWEFWIHGFSSILLYVFYTVYILGKYKKDFSLGSSFGFGLLWVALFCFFYFLMAVKVFELNWLEVLGAFNIFNNELLPIFMLIIFASPPAVWVLKS